MYLNLTGKVALVTGASRGIGAAIAKLMAQSGAEVWFGIRQAEHPIEAPNVHYIELDVENEGNIKTAFRAIKEKHGGLDILVNNAGIMEPAMIATTRRSSMEKMLQVNLVGGFLCAQLASRLMLQRQGGSIINISSIAGLKGAAGYAAYSASKAAVLGLTLSMAKELAPHNIRVNAITPGFIETDLTASLSSDAREKVISSIGMQRCGTVNDVAPAVLFLASDASSYITGQIITIDGAMQL